ITGGHGFWQVRAVRGVERLEGIVPAPPCRWILLPNFVTVEISRRGTQVVRERSAKPLCVGSIPTRASRLSVDGSINWGDHYRRVPQVYPSSSVQVSSRYGARLLRVDLA